ncbi:MAG TPA: LysE family translocator [Stellaceae bacterium]|nr:LysE family translocator [Stellaceae bacterium]
MNWELFAAFTVVAAILFVTPGPVVTLVIATGASHGVRAALTAVAGTSLGLALLLAAIALGLNWVLEHTGAIFEVLRWVGAAYLVWVGIRAWRNAGKITAAIPSVRVSFVRGVAVALTNPKTIAFFTAFLPQFVDPKLPAAPQLAAMCVTSVLLAATCDSGWAVAAGLGRAWLMKPSRAKMLGRLSGAVLIGGGIWLSLARRPAALG